MFIRTHPPIFNHTNPVYNLPLYFWNVYFNSILPPMFRSSLHVFQTNYVPRNNSIKKGKWECQFLSVSVLPVHWTTVRAVCTRFQPDGWDAIPKVSAYITIRSQSVAAPSEFLNKTERSPYFNQTAYTPHHTLLCHKIKPHKGEKQSSFFSHIVLQNLN